MRDEIRECVVVNVMQLTVLHTTHSNLHASFLRENSYASHSDADVGQSVIDRYSKVIKDFVDDAVSLTANTSTNQYSLSKHGKIPFDGATVAVMERLTLHDILVRIPVSVDIGAWLLLQRREQLDNFISRPLTRPD